jgi:hypothetical protein
MNDFTKRIEVEKSSLLSLKAELLRKQEEALANRKNLPELSQHKSKKKVEKLPKIINNESALEDAELKKSRLVLEMKQKYYDRMVENKSLDQNSLVLFNKKGNEERKGKKL